MSTLDTCPDTLLDRSTEIALPACADSALGQISVAEALAVQVKGGKPNSYGISGASAVSPLPLPSPAVTATATGTPHPRATVKGVKKT